MNWTTENTRKFIDIWENASNMEDVKKHFPDLKSSALAARATYLRKHDIKLRKFKNSEKIDIKGLQQYINDRNSNTHETITRS